LTQEAVTRAIPIPVWFNTFWSPKSDPHKKKSRQSWQQKGGQNWQQKNKKPIK